MEKAQRRIIMASQSLFRGKALELLGLKYESIPSGVDEEAIQHENPDVRSEMLAIAKASAVGVNNQDAIIVAGDYFVVMDGKAYEKPKDIAEAKKMLKAFSGRVLDNICSICVYDPQSRHMCSGVAHAHMRFRKLTGAEIDDYVLRYPVTKYAAAYDLDGVARFCEHVEGEPIFIYGLPVSLLVKYLRKVGLEV